MYIIIRLPLLACSRDLRPLQDTPHTILPVHFWTVERVKKLAIS